MCRTKSSSPTMMLPNLMPCLYISPLPKHPHCAFQPPPLNSSSLISKQLWGKKSSSNQPPPTSVPNQTKPNNNHDRFPKFLAQFSEVAAMKTGPRTLMCTADMMNMKL